MNNGSVTYMVTSRSTLTSSRLPTVSRFFGYRSNRGPSSQTSSEQMSSDSTSRNKRTSLEKDGMRRCGTTDMCRHLRQVAYNVLQAVMNGLTSPPTKVCVATFARSPMVPKSDIRLVQSTRLRLHKSLAITISIVY